MKNKYFLEATYRLKKDYQLDVIEDILLARQEHVVLFADCSNPFNIELEVVSGSLAVIGFEDSKSIKLSTLLSYFDYNNSYGYIAGREAYFQGVYQQLHDFRTPKDVSFPILYNGVRKWLRFNIYPSAKHEHISIFTVTDVTVLHTQEEETFFKTHTDSLTQLFNKYTFDYHYGLKYLKPGFHVMFMDLDNFKSINDRYGHTIGNQCLIEFATLLKKYQSNDNHFYRLGGDEFIGLMVGSSDEILSISHKIIQDIRQLKILNTDIKLTVSMGVMKATKSEDLARKADSLMYEVKSSGKDNLLYAIEST